MFNFVPSLGENASQLHLEASIQRSAGCDALKIAYEVFRKPEN